ncbi:TetR/AcrR family transcriptional regulator [Mesorhizobium sp. 1M-11]|uniref:TetR/AcrR family transcriptional regulator n=1 Tax=Mesorhizobium sp. 1M-11 TaxID=1529006 RepID=UPI0006C76907|nr:TetR/AcrR family transcriptional regulator [Mesorhizobium sp. 1M-11]
MDRTALSKPVEPRQNRALKTRAALLEAVETLVAAEGHEAVTTTRIAMETGTAVGTIYRYFVDREALLLAAYEATVKRIVAQCASKLEALPADLAATDAAHILLSHYLEAAESIPAHTGLLAAMRSIRPIEADQQGNNQAGITGDLLVPFFARYAPGAQNLKPVQLRFLSVLTGTMVDLYLVTGDGADRARLREEIEAHVVLMVERAGRESDDGIRQARLDQQR